MPPVELAAPETRPRLRRLAGRNLADFILPALIASLAIGVTAIQPRFASGSNLANLASQVAPLLILSIGEAFAIISGGLDLSLASVMSVSGVVGVLSMSHVGVAAGVALMVLTGIVTGLVSGAVIAYFRTTPLIVTLGMLSITQAIALILANGVPIYDVPDSLTSVVGFGTVHGVPVAALIAVLLLGMASVLLRWTVFGRYVYAIGSSRSAALKSGLDVPLTTMLVYGISGMTGGIAGVVMTAWTGAAQPIAEPSLTLQSLAAVVLGGVALAGGSGNMLHVLYGVLILGMLSNAMNMLGISAYYQTLVVGTVIILAVVLDRMRREAH